jgi:transmembrane sensor
MGATGDDPARDDKLREEAAAWLARLRGPSTPADHAAFEAWYNAAPEHAAAYDGVLQSWEASGLARLTSAARARPSLQPRSRHPWRYAIAVIAATIVIVLLAFGAHGLVGTRTGQPMEFASGGGEIRTVDLADGSRITLDTATVLQTTYSADERRIVLLRGRARFAVAHDRARPFIVMTRLGSVVAYGTVFDVAFDGKRVRVSLLEGSVEVRRAAPANQAGSSRMLTPGHSVIVEAGAIRVPTDSTPAEADWPNAMLSFEDAPLDQVIAAANRHGPPDIVLADPMLTKLRFTGTFKAADTEQLARLIAASFKLELSRRHDGTLVLSSPRASTDTERKKIPG